MLETIKKALQAILDDLDSGNTNLTEEEEFAIIDTINRLLRKERLISKYQAYTYLNISRATFDRLVQEGRLPRGKKIAGFKELFWDEKQIRDYLRKERK